ncbi:hypothetical protein SacmaDRAFT_5672 [Saccharomonospora marina XMU15]|uniref:Uncharacterized protein n=1 Tax=Saccharomonospora marina XMU15 TaxID=882083 RepID=H5XB56_9PSEU|nr:hypothetical protein [Saccharomonospora marina]EHR53786.1 hypothetical protein SacmaDRAFT_5672 [Saccharomonospora marina XMU15]
MYLAVVICLAGLLLVAAAITVGYEDQRAARRHAKQRRARLARLGESDPLAPARLHANLHRFPPN